MEVFRRVRVVAHIKFCLINVFRVKVSLIVGHLHVFVLGIYMHVRLFGDELTLNRVDLVVSFCPRILENVPLNAELIVVHDWHMVGLKVVPRDLFHHMVLQLFELGLSFVRGIPDIESNLKGVKPLLNIWAHVLGRHVVLVVFNKVVVSNLSPMLNRWRVVWEMEVVSWVYF